MIYTPGPYASRGVISTAPVGAGLTMDAAGNIFGVNAQTKVFELSPNGNGGWTSTVIYDLGGGGKVSGTPALDQAGNIYCTTTATNGIGAGTLYKLSLTDGEWKKQTLESWKAYYNGPLAGVILDEEGNVYGTTGGDYGTVFELAVKAKGGYEKKVLWNFLGWDGGFPYAILILDSAGNLYGTTSDGGERRRGCIQTDSIGYSSSPHRKIQCVRAVPGVDIESSSYAFPARNVSSRTVNFRTRSSRTS